MQFKDLDDKGYKKVCEFIAARAKGVTVYDQEISIKRSGLNNYFMFGMLEQIIIERNFADFCMGARPFCNIRVALIKNEQWERAGLLKQVDPVAV